MIKLEKKPKEHANMQWENMSPYHKMFSLRKSSKKNKNSQKNCGHVFNW